MFADLGGVFGHVLFFDFFGKLQFLVQIVSIFVTHDFLHKRCQSVEILVAVAIIKFFGIDCDHALMLFSIIIMDFFGAYDQFWFCQIKIVVGIIGVQIVLCKITNVGN